jgi:hypothetical protein
LAREDEIHHGNPEGIPKEYCLGTFLPPSLLDGDEYWPNVTAKWFALSAHLGLSTCFLIFTMNPCWAEYQAVKRGSETSANSAMSRIILKTKPSALTI